MTALAMIEGRRAFTKLSAEPFGGDEESIRHKAAVRGSLMLRDAILLAKGLTPPPVKEEPRPFPKTEAEALCAPKCPLCESPLKPIYGFIANIQQTVAAYYGIDHKSMVSAERRIDISHPRQVAMFLACELTHKPYSEIGRRFGGRDHTTVIHARKVVARRIAQDPEIELDVEILREKLAA